jgi:hypothetical protein
LALDAGDEVTAMIPPRAAGNHTMDICTVKPWFEILLVAVFALVSAGFWYAAPKHNAIAASCAGLAALRRWIDHKL